MTEPANARAAHGVPDIVIITGMSGAGRSTAANALEDLGWYVVDNLPPALLPTMLDLADRASLPGVAAIILGLSNAGSAAGFAHLDVIVPLVIGAVLVAGFTGYALRRPGSLVDVRLLGRRPVASASAVLFFSGFSLYGAMLLLPLYYQEVRGYTALTAGIMLVPQGVGTLLSRNLAGRLTDKIGARVIAIADEVAAVHADEAAQRCDAKRIDVRTGDARKKAAANGEIKEPR